MSKIIQIIIAILMMTPVVGNFNGKDFPNNNGSIIHKIPKGIALNKVPFEEVKDYNVLPQALQSKIEEMKMEQGYYLFHNNKYGMKEEGYTILLSMGEKNTSGYGIKVTSVEDCEGITLIHVEEVKPEEGSITMPVMSYPTAVIKVKNTTPNIMVISRQGNNYKNLNQGKKH